MVYEVDGTYLEDGDEIKGTFYLITSGGEKEIPYSFCAESTTSGKALGNLKTAQDFADIAKRDLDMALRLFEYRDFVEAPFMQDLKVRTLYDGLKGRPDRRKELEEFWPGDRFCNRRDLSYEKGLGIHKPGGSDRLQFYRAAKAKY